MDKRKSRTYIAMAADISERLGDREYSVGFDLGVGSTGVAVVALEPDEQGDLYPTDLIHATSRIFPSSKGAEERRMKRGQRNAIRHKSHRMRWLWKVLSEKDLMLPFSDEEVSDPARLRFDDEEIRKDPYSLRVKGLREQLTLHELGVALYHIAGHRGSSSIRTFLDSGDLKDDEKAKMRTTEEISKTYGLNTYIEVLYESRRINNTNFRNSLNASEKTPLPTRDIIENEVEVLLEKQKKFYPDVLSDEYVQKIKDVMFYENEKLVPEAGNCPYFPNEKKLPRVAFINEERRIWEAVNNIRIKIEIQEENRFKTISEPLSGEKKKILFDFLRSGKDLTVTEFKRLFSEYKNSSEIRLQGTTKGSQQIKGFRFKELEDSPWFSSLSENERLHFLECYINCPDDKKLKDILKREFCLSDENVQEALHMKLVEGYAPVGLSAMKIILNYIVEEGISYQEAEAKAVEEGRLACFTSDIVFDSLPYYGMVIPASTQALMGKAWHSSFVEKRARKSFTYPETNRDEEKYGRIANPVVHQCLNELRKLINELIEILGKKPKTICVELSRDLKVGQDKRDEISRRNNEKERENKRIFDTYCKPNNLSKSYIKKFRLYEEQKEKCPYCLRSISVNDIITNNVDIDHIFPKEDTGDSSYDNLVLAHKTCNETKKVKKIPYVAYGSEQRLWSNIEQYLSSTTMSVRKRHKFNITEEEYEKYLEQQSFLPRFNPDNAYIARVACQYLQSLYPKEEKRKAVRTIRGHETALLRRAWKLNDITNGLAESIGLIREDEYTDEKNRTDNRHHALDAIVAAYFTQNYATVIQTAASRGIKTDVILKRLPIPKYYRQDKELAKLEQVREFSSYIRNFMETKTFVSRKQVTSRNGELVKDTQYSVLARSKDDVILCTKKSIKDIGASSVYGDKRGSLEFALNKDFKLPTFLTETASKNITVLQENNKKKFKDIIACLERARESLEESNKQRISSGKKAKQITEKNILAIACEMVGGVYYQISNQKANKLYIRNTTNSAFDTGDNFSLDLYLGEKEKVQGEVIRKINAMKKDYVPEYKQKGFTLLERIYPKDVLEIDLISAAGSSKKALSQSIVSPNAPEGRTFVVVDTFTEIGKTIQIWYTPLSISNEVVKSSFCVSGIENMNVRKVVLSSLGLVVYRSRFIKGAGACGD